MNMLRKSSKLAAFALLGVLASVSQAQDSYSLRLALEAGKTLEVKTVSSTKMSFTGPIDQSMNTKTTMVQAYKFDKGDEGWWKFDLSTTDIKLEGDQGMPGMNADPSAMVESVKKVKVSGDVNNLGKTRNVKVGGDDQLDMMTKGLVASNIEYLTQIGFLSITFPEAPVSVGTKWKSDFDMAKILEANGGGFLTNAKGVVPIEFEVLGFEDLDGVKTAKIQVFLDGKVTFDSSMGGSGTMTTTSKGNMWLNLATGLPVKSDTKLANNIDIGGQMTITQEVDINTTSEIKG